MRFLWSVAWRNLWRQKRRSLITAVAIAVGVALCMTMIAFSDGMYDEMFEVMVEQKLGHVQVHHPDYPTKHIFYDTLADRANLLETLDEMPGTVAASPNLSSFGLLGGDTISKGGKLVGISPARDSQVSPLQGRIINGEYLSAKPAKEILLGHKIAQDLEVNLGGEVLAVTQCADGSVGNDLFKVVGIYKTGDVLMDDSGGYIHLTDAEDLFGLIDQAHSITLVTSHSDQVEAYAGEVKSAISNDNVEVQAWWEASPQTAELMSMRDATTFFMLAIVFGVAAFGVINTMMMSVFERTREMGVLRALGLRPGKLVWLVILESFFLAAVAATIGLVLGGLLDWYLVVHGLDFTSSTPDGFSFEGVMLDPVMKGSVRAWPIIATVISVFFVSILASLWPAWRAAHLQPVEAIRTE
ncbi:MAG: ABC transporter permease [Proteobacteria bacterium]|nr:ABC transporter permease [Pseudomonadota bacterium]